MISNKKTNKTTTTTTTTTTTEKKDRFHAFGPQRLVSGKVDQWYINYHPTDKITGGEAFSSGLDCCSRNTVSFHYVEAKEASILYDILRKQHDYHLMGDATRRALWPQPKDLSYSTPPSSNDTMWEFLTKKLHVCPS
jgi:hypothetical protein